MINGFIESDVRIHYLSNNLNETKPLSLLFVPGVMMPAWIWENQLEYFAKEYRVVAMDPRSQGDSEQSTEGHYSYARAKDIKALVDQLNLDPFVLIGWSLAVPEVINYAAHFGSDLKGLVLIDGLAGLDPSVPFYQSTVEFWTQMQIDRISNTKAFIKKIFQKPQSDAYFEKLTEVALRTPTNTVMTLMENYILQDFRSLLPKITIPTLIATVEGPRLDYMKSMKELLPQGQLEIFKEANHALFVDQPDQFNRILSNFIYDLSRYDILSN